MKTPSTVSRRRHWPVAFGGVHPADHLARLAFQIGPNDRVDLHERVVESVTHAPIAECCAVY